GVESVGSVAPGGIFVHLNFLRGSLIRRIVHDGNFKSGLHRVPVTIRHPNTLELEIQASELVAIAVNVIDCPFQGEPVARIAGWVGNLDSKYPVVITPACATISGQCMAVSL